jgi:AraC family transcriptional regulator of adaptative response/methylated-DNA-[protein]-cysteine methyltransferase
MTYRITGLPRASFAQYFGRSAEELEKLGARRVFADADRGFPCRITLEDAAKGESLILLNYTSNDVAGPYRSAHAIYVREKAGDGSDEGAAFEGELPPVFAGRTLSLRGFDDAGMLQAARLAEPGGVEGAIDDLFANAAVACIHAHNAAYGCFAATIERFGGGPHASVVASVSDPFPVAPAKAGTPLPRVTPQGREKSEIPAFAGTTSKKAVKSWDKSLEGTDRIEGGISKMVEAVIDEERAWQAVLARDRSFDGRFVTGVLSTGIYCRPSCAARHPLRENVRFFADPAVAEATGLRACLRCRPGDVARDEDAVARALALLGEGAEQAPSLVELAEAVGYSATHFQRVFKRAVGLSPAGYIRARKVERAGEALSEGSSVTAAIYEAGFGAASRFYEATQGRMGMTPSAWRDGGRGVTIRWAVVATTLGQMLVAATDKGVCRLSFAEDAADLAARFPKADLVEGDEAFAALLTDVVGAVERPSQMPAIPLDVQGTAFQEAVWRELQRIPAGETRTYAQIAAAVGRPAAVRAAGSANGANAVAVLIPCHRVIRSDGSVGGYAYGDAIKRELLRREQG